MPTLKQRVKNLLGMGPRDVNLPIEGATPEAQRRAAAQKSADTIRKLQEVGKRARQAQGLPPSDTQSSEYDFRKRNNLRRGQ